ncbi:hypothetical protein Fleli_0754 [Bernardetia litoralis DSM 6794]|uniref:Lipoprotein n=1 Tax=Bernardetia litoralis (strain ATCC 23117 / DSM 6794 / NBRC 15988 / NCIMB 1366 / Fx l1 / Sio-4) TaxID=880071 RepID=I4AGX9_BERLS|nr:hypothetical protein [Bernardetia litoralis]AFM03214.1 hypothetical protein Fleli_0754 [Bernardetia litoralis DSM 6794]
MKIYHLKLTNLFCLALLFGFGLFSCQSNTNSGIENQEIRIAEEEQEVEVSFMLSNVEDDINGMQSTIKATINGKETEVTKATNCTLAEKEEYESMKVPTDATWACKCWWAGAGENFYALKKDNKVEFYGKEIYEQMEEKYDKWELLKILE